MTSLNETTDQNNVPGDQCPEWAHQLILKIRDLEVELGNLLPPNNQSSDQNKWWEQDLHRIASRLETGGKDSLDAMETAVESTFQRVSRDLLRLGYSAEKIAHFINERLTAHSRLKYCSAAEVAASAIDP